MGMDNPDMASIDGPIILVSKDGENAKKLIPKKEFPAFFRIGDDS